MCRIAYQYSDWFKIVIGELGAWGAETGKTTCCNGGWLRVSGLVKHNLTNMVASSYDCMGVSAWCSLMW